MKAITERIIKIKSPNKEGSLLTIQESNPPIFHELTMFPLPSKTILGSTCPDVAQKYEKCREERTYAKGEAIFRVGDPAEHVFFIKEGHVKEVRHSADGRNITICVVGADGIFGTGSFAGGRHVSDCIAETETTVVSYPVHDFLNLMGECPEIGKAVLKKISDLLHDSKDAHILSHESVRKRILKELIVLSGQFGDTIPLTRQEMADLVGCTVETAIRVFSKLEAEGLVSLGRSRIVIKSVQELSDHMNAL